MSQCPHCRGLRRARSSHVKCDCGEKPHAKEDHEHDTATDLGDGAALQGPDGTGPEKNTCCCSHGARCTCALKKEYLDPVLEVDDASRPPRHARKPTLTSANSDPLTVFKNHHHKPVHKHNHAAHDSAPYRIPIPHSISGNSDLAHKSVDSLPLPRKAEHSHSQLQESISSAQQEVRRVRSEHGSPEPGVFRYGDLNGDLPPLNLPYPAYSNSFDGTSPPPLETYGYQTSGGFDKYYNTPDYTAPDEEPMLSAGLAMPPVDWSVLNLPRENGGMPAAYSQPPSYASFDHSNIGQPGLTTSSSEDISDSGDYISSILRQTQTVSTPSEISSNPYRLSTASSYMSMPQTAALPNMNADTLDIDAFLDNAKNSTASPVSFEGSNINEPGDPERFIKHGITVQDAQKLAHPANQLPPTQAMGELSLPTPSDENDPLWGAPFNTEDTTSSAGQSPSDVWDR